MLKVSVLIVFSLDLNSLAWVCRDEFAKSTRKLDAIGIHVQLNGRRSHAATSRLDPDEFLLHYFPARADTSPPDNEGPTSIDLAAFQHRFDAPRQRDLGSTMMPQHSRACVACRTSNKKQRVMRSMRLSRRSLGNKSSAGQ
jgi:hypothetical protein